MTMKPSSHKLRKKISITYTHPKNERTENVDNYKRDSIQLKSKYKKIERCVILALS